MQLTILTTLHLLHLERCHQIVDNFFFLFFNQILNMKTLIVRHWSAWFIDAHNLKSCCTVSSLQTVVLCLAPFSVKSCSFVPTPKPFHATLIQQQYLCNNMQGICERKRNNQIVIVLVTFLYAFTFYGLSRLPLNVPNAGGQMLSARVQKVN